MTIGKENGSGQRQRIGERVSSHEAMLDWIAHRFSPLLPRRIMAKAEILTQSVAALHLESYRPNCQSQSFSMFFDHDQSVEIGDHNLYAGLFDLPDDIRIGVTVGDQCAHVG